MRTKFNLNIVVEAETGFEAQQLVKDYVAEIRSGTDWEDHDIVILQLDDATEEMPELTGKCYECGEKTDSYYCDSCNQRGLEEMDRTNDQLEAEYGHLRTQ